MENKSSATRSKVIAILLVISLIANVGVFFYGFINNIQMKKERMFAIASKAMTEKYMSEYIQCHQQLETALEEARQAKDFALAQAMAAQEAAQNKK